MKQLMNTMQGLWRWDLTIRESLTESGDLMWNLVGLVVPFGWMYLLRRLEPVRLRVRYDRHS